MDPNLILNKILRLARLDTTVFDEVRDDANELIPAMIVAGVSALLAGLGATLFYEFNFDYGPEKPWLNTFILGGVFMAALYLVWVLIAYVIIVQVYKASADLQSLLRTMGYAARAAGAFGADVHPGALPGVRNRAAGAAVRDVDLRGPGSDQCGFDTGRDSKHGGVLSDGAGAEHRRFLQRHDGDGRGTVLDSPAHSLIVRDHESSSNGRARFGVPVVWLSRLDV
ncbi:MAG: hypothetical protein IPN07_04035 [Dehalococcoidia bacterium]|nr:hypothetical protein [Dehalococcoidia bacterium]